MDLSHLITLNSLDLLNEIKRIAKANNNTPTIINTFLEFLREHSLNPISCLIQENRENEIPKEFLNSECLSDSMQTILEKKKWREFQKIISLSDIFHYELGESLLTIEGANAFSPEELIPVIRQLSLMPHPEAKKALNIVDNYISKNLDKFPKKVLSNREIAEGALVNAIHAHALHTLDLSKIQDDDWIYGSMSDSPLIVAAERGYWDFIPKHIITEKNLSKQIRNENCFTISIIYKSKSYIPKGMWTRKVLNSNPVRATLAHTKEYEKLSLEKIQKKINESLKLQVEEKLNKIKEITL